MIPLDHERMLHDLAWSGMNVFMDHVGERYSEEEQRELAAFCYNALRAMLEAHCRWSERQAHRLTPTNN